MLENKMSARKERKKADITHPCMKAVYVQVEAPTSATGVLLRPQGYERYYCSCLEGCGEPNRVIQDIQEYVYAKDIELYKLQEPIAIGNYVIPFQVQLPDAIPGSFYKKSESGPEWLIQVHYGFQAFFTGIDAGKAECCIQVLETGDFDDSSTSVNRQVEVRGKTIFSKGTLNIHAHIDSPEYTIGNIMKLCLDFVKVGSCRPKISYVKVQLRRHLKIVFGKERFLRMSSPLKKLMFDFQVVGPAPMYGHPQYGQPQAHNLTQPEDFPTCMWPEHGPVTLWSTQLNQSEQFNLIRGVDNLHIPLKAIKTPSVMARYAQCQYSIDLEILVNDNHVTLSIPIPRVKERETTVPIEPPWVSDRDCKLILSQHDAQLDIHYDNDNIGRNFSNLPKTAARIGRTIVRLSSLSSQHSSLTEGENSTYTSVTDSIGGIEYVTIVNCSRRGMVGGASFDHGTMLDVSTAVKTYERLSDFSSVRDSVRNKAGDNWGTGAFSFQSDGSSIEGSGSST